MIQISGGKSALWWEQKRQMSGGKSDKLGGGKSDKGKWTTAPMAMVGPRVVCHPAGAAPCRTHVCGYVCNRQV